MTSSGEPAPEQRPRRTRALALIGALAVAAAVATWAEVHYTGGDAGSASSAGGSVSQDSLALPQSGDSSSSAAPSAMPDAAEMLPATVDVPAGANNPTPFQATRYALGTAANCADVLTPTATAAATTSCQGYVAASYVSADHTVMASVTVLGYPDAATAGRAKPAFGAATAAGTVAIFRTPGQELPALAQLPATEQQRVQQIGRFVTVIQTAAVTGANQTTPATLAATEYTLSAEVGDTVLWDE
ncbi:hypothetical protein DN069_24795 [Streptacidiphilus pinicola]|uniref:Uncharacterized protein n=1 Tax=Streptacidiphilus pinicola TaxID=2219663 RepID=A0A2X0IDA5_9ACTN|nr:hypothetical protein [Streptacidiphilus pinicola]RAG82974.1 hypothetical protein DN069_24795 [Streptacidiphilus pinicola]